MAGSIRAASAKAAIPFLCMAALYAPINAQTAADNPPPPQKVITIRMLDSRTGHLIATRDYLVRVNHLEAQHADWVQQNEDGSGRVNLPADATVLSVRATYDSTTLIYRNCDADKDRGSAQSMPGLDRWYSIDTILSQGVVAPNYCGAKKVADKLQVFAKPGEYVFFVRKLNPREQLDQ